MRLFTLMAAVAVLAFSANAQDDARSRKIIDEMITKVRSFETMKIEFVTELNDKENDLQIKQNGTVQVKGKKFHLVLDDNTIISDGATVWTYASDMNEVTINDPEELGEDLDPSQLFTMYEKGFKSQYIKEETVDGKKVDVVKLFPLKPAEKPYHTIILSINKTTKLAERVVLLYKEGNDIGYMVNKFTGDPALSATLFTFNKANYPGVEVNDMR